MVKAQFNRFTRWFILAVSILTLSIFLYVGKTLALQHKMPQLCVHSAFEVLLSPHGLLSVKRKSLHGLRPVVLCLLIPASARVLNVGTFELQAPWSNTMSQALLLEDDAPKATS